MTKIRICSTLVGIALSCSVFASTGSAQTRTLTIQVDGKSNMGKVVLQAVQAAPQHLGSGPIDMNNLPQDVLDCDVCRQRLGLPPLNRASSKVAQPRDMSQPQVFLQQSIPSQTAPPQPGVIRMLGSPGMMSSKVAEQMAQQGFVVEEFKPPQLAQDAIQLGDIPPEARQQFMQGLNLPQGARVMSAEVRGQQSVPEAVVSISNTRLDAGANRNGNALGGPGSQLPAEVVIPKSDGLALEALLTPSKPEPESIPQPEAKPLLALQQTIAELQQNLEQQTQENAKLNGTLERTKFESQKRMELADAANREALMMLEKRTAEVTELQLQIQSQQEAMANLQAKSKKSDEKHPKPRKLEAPKKGQSKGKGQKADKPSGDA